MTFEKHLRSVSRAAHNSLVSSGSPGKYSMIDCFLWLRTARFRVLFCVWCSAADTHIKLLDRVVCRASFLTGGMFECDLAHHRSVAILYKIGCNPMLPLYGALPLAYVSVRVTRGAVIAHRYPNSPLTTRFLFPCQYLCGTILVTQDGVGLVTGVWAFDGVGLVGFKSRANAFLLA